MSPGGKPPQLVIRTFGTMQIERDGVSIPVPASRKARAILGYLILSPRPVGRQRLCDLFFDIPDDPRASLRWTLAKLRAALDADGEGHIVSSGDSLKFEPAGAAVDVLDVLRGASADLPDAAGLFLEDAELPDRQDFSIWLQAAREDIRTASIQRIRTLIEVSPAPDRKLPLYRRLLTLEPLDEAASAGLAHTLAQLGRMDDARETVANAERALSRAGIKPGAALRQSLKVSDAPAKPAPAPQQKPSAPATVFDLLPSVAILPFHNYSTDLIPDDMMEGFLESTIHMLSRFRSFRVTAQGAVMAYKGKMSDPLEIGKATGAQYVVGGSVMARGPALKIRYRVVDGSTGALVSSGDVDLATDSMAPAMLEDAPARLVVYLMHQVYDLALKHSRNMPEDARTAVDHFHCGVLAFIASPPDPAEALRRYELALAMQPNYPNAMAGAAWCRTLLGRAAAEPRRSEALALAKAAIVAGNDDAMALSAGAWCLILIDGDIESAIRAIDLAVTVNPLARMAWDFSAQLRTMRGEYETPMAHWEKSDACSPLGANADQINSGRALCCWIAGHYEAAADWAKRALERAPNNAIPLGIAVAAAFKLGDVEATRRAARALLDQHPHGADAFALKGIPFVVPEIRQRFIDAIASGLKA